MTNGILGDYFCSTVEQIKGDNAKSFDVVVIGSGMYGSYIASKLYYWGHRKPGSEFEKKLKILILEAGPFIVHEHYENLPPKTNIFDRYRELPYMKSPYICHVHRAGASEKYFGEITKHNYCVGGKSLTWGKWAPRLTEEALESWPQEVRKFFKNEEAGYKRVEEETGVSDYTDLIYGTLFESLKKKLNSVSSAHLKIVDPPVAVASNSTVSGLYSPDAFSSLGWLLENINFASEEHHKGKTSGKSIHLVPNTLAYELKVQEGRVYGIEVVDTRFNKKHFLNISSNCDVILAATAVESTRLALNSLTLKTHLEEEREKELIGRNLMGHLFSAVKVRIQRSALKLQNTEKLQSALFHIQHASKDLRDYHFQLFCSSNSSTERKFDEGLFDILYKMVYEHEQLVDTLELQKSDWIYILALSCSEIQGKPDVPLHIGGSNWMDLSKDQFDRFGEVSYAKPYLKWESSKEDEEFWDKVLSTLFELLSTLAPHGDIEYFIPKTSNPDEKEGYWTKTKPGEEQFNLFKPSEAFWNSRHEAGTLWMGENANTSVTDLDGKFHHIQNVYCADQAIFPTVGSANPVLTCLALDRKIARAILDRYKNFPDDFSKDFPDEFDLESKGFRPLFDGASFDGWAIQSKGRASILKDLKILELELEPNGTHGVAWYRSKTFSEFELIVDWKAFDYLRKEDELIIANSGIVIHSPDPAKDRDDIYKFGYEIPIDESGYDHINKVYGSPLHKTGAIYNLAPANRGNTKKSGLYGSEEKPVFWNRFRIVSTKAKIEVFLNGKPVSSLSPLDPSKNTEGYICLQFHTNKVQFRNILIKELPST